MAVECPFCRCPTPEMWRPLVAIHDAQGQALKEPQQSLKFPLGRNPTLVLDTAVFTEMFWMRCQNHKCQETIVLVRHGYPFWNQAVNLADLDMWYAVPQKRNPRTLDPLIKEPFRRDYTEAALILEDSPRMSAVLSRRILGDLLKTFAGRPEYNLATRIDNFIEDAQFPSAIKGNLHHLREIADFGAHTQQDQTSGEIIDVGREEAEWTLEVIDGLFDYFIIGPEKDRERRTKFDKKIEQAGRKPIKKENEP